MRTNTCAHTHSRIHSALRCTLFPFFLLLIPRLAPPSLPLFFTYWIYSCLFPLQCFLLQIHFPVIAALPWTPNSKGQTEKTQQRSHKLRKRWLSTPPALNLKHNNCISASLFSCHAIIIPSDSISTSILLFKWEKPVLVAPFPLDTLQSSPCGQHTHSQL